MAKRQRNNRGGLLGAENLAIVLVTIGLIFFISKFFDLKNELKVFHQNVFNTPNAVNSFSLSFNQMAFEVNSIVTSKPLPDQEKFEDYPFLAEPITYRLTHYITPLSHHGKLEIKLSENSNLSGFFSEDIHADFFVAVNQNISFTVERLHYQTLLKEIVLGKVNGNINFKGVSQIHISDFNATLNHLNFRSSDLRLELNSISNELLVKTPELKMNNHSITDVTGKTVQSIYRPYKKIVKNGAEVSLTSSRSSSYTGRYKFIPVNLVVNTDLFFRGEERIGSSSGKLDIPVRLVDAMLDPLIDQEFKEREKQARSQNDAKTTAIFMLSEGPKKLALKRKLISKYVDPDKIKVNSEFMTINFGEEEKTEADFSTNGDWMKEIISRYQAGLIDDLITRLEALKLKKPDRHESYFALGWIYSKNNDQVRSVENYSISCSLGYEKACILAGDHFNFKNDDADRAFIMYQLACDKNLGNGCAKAGVKAQEKGELNLATTLLKKSCEELKDMGGCYLLARHLNQLERPQSEVLKYLDLACGEIKNACHLASTFKRGKRAVIPNRFQQTFP